MNLYIICGYGIPKDIFSDENYRMYLNLVFNKIYTLSANQACVIIPSGGPTEMEPPFLGTEADAMGKYLEFMMQRPEVKEQTKGWQILLEDKSFSSLENLVFAKQLIQEKGLTGDVTIFCEQTREDRMREMAKQIFQKDVSVEPIDFDVSKNRYLDPAILRSKEEEALREALWTLEKEERLQQHHELFKRKFAFFRERIGQGMSHVDIVEEWFRYSKTLIQELMPEHPLLRD